MTTSSLPPHVYAVRDRHGKVRYRFVRKGWRSGYLHGEPGSVEFHRTYAEMIEAGPLAPKGARQPAKVIERSLDDLAVRMKAGVKWGKKSARTQHVQSRCAAIGTFQAIGGFQPRPLTDEALPSPDDAVSNLFARINAEVQG